MADPGFWNDTDAAREVIAEANRIKEWTEPWQRLRAKVDELSELEELLDAEEDEALRAEWDA
jgi:peptide chain release factor 2